MQMLNSILQQDFSTSSLNFKTIFFGTSLILAATSIATTIFSKLSSSSQYNKTPKKGDQEDEEDDDDENNSVSDSLERIRDHAAQQFANALSRILLDQARRGRSDYEFSFFADSDASPLSFLNLMSLFDYFLEARTVLGIFTVPVLVSYRDTIDSEGTRKLVKEMLEGTFESKEMKAKKEKKKKELLEKKKKNKKKQQEGEGGEKEADEEEEEDKEEEEENKRKQQQYSFAMFNPNHNKNKLNENNNNNNNNNQQKLKVNWSIHSQYGKRAFAPKYVLQCDWA